MRIIKNTVLQGKHNKPILTDVFYKETRQPKPIVIFCHGYKGFKDWGAWNLMAEAFANTGFFFVKFNFSHNGGTVEQPIDFPDLDAFGNNNYTKELGDLESVIDWVSNNTDFKNEADTNNISLIGHSRAGGIVTIKAEEDARIKKVITLAGVSDFGSRSSTIGDLEQWKKDGVKYVVNGRTKQQMPHFYQFYLDFKENEERLTIKRAVQNLQIPHLIIHGDNDTSIFIKEAENQHLWSANSQFEVVKEANHVFGASHPWKSKSLPTHLLEVVDKCCNFIIN
ncbi:MULTISPECIES: alpha/beta hydrolase family protein [Tenacibaculum]|uniref:alpha/beta hydrolase family protein n=1 Tax=Tenacibaculum TaxID=104267 RepID=UPI001F0A4DB8|nr:MULTISPECIES: alpha/beta hydrolase [Tenacibaculum]MCH3883728.1 alpha/beta hydrolase [Tenacibaculum aquimarinum]MDO6599003.1 alpha/beta hydrolase [Tenacibaculum sp. 1_MG-2023]